MSLVKTVNLCQKYNERDIIRNIDLGVEQGEIFALFGPTGTGKTTLLRLLGLLDMPSSGKIYFDGIDTCRSGKLRLELRRRMAFVLQKPVVFNASVYDNVACGLKWRREDKNNIRQKVNTVLDMVSLSTYKDRNARTLSGGETQRVAIARSIVIEPELLLLDEPSANLDPVSTLRIEELIQNIFRQYKTTIIIATHDLSQGRRLAHRVGIMVEGEIMQVGKADEIFDSPLNREIAEFVGVENIADGVIVSSSGEIVTLDLKSKLIEAISDCAVGDEVHACIRSEDITLSPSKGISSARNALPGEITRIITSGALVNVEVDCGFPLVAIVTKKSAEELDLKSGAHVYASFKASAVHVIKK